jgi:anti-sigma B factor antagonist
MISGRELVPSAGHVPFAVQRVAGGTDSTVAIQGELDLATAPAVSRCVESIVTEGPTRIIFDFTDVTFMDSSGISVLMRAKHSLPDDGQIVIRQPRSAIRRVLTITGMDEALLIDDESNNV